MDISLSKFVDIGAPIDEVYRWISDDGYITLWDNRTVSRSAGHIVRRRGAELTIHSERRFSTPPTMWAVEQQREGESERMQFDLSPINHGTRLTCTVTSYDPPVSVQKAYETKREELEKGLFLHLDLIKTLAEGGRTPTTATPVENTTALQFMSKMSEAGQQAWESADPMARDRAAQSVASGTTACNAEEAWLVVALAEAILQEVGKGGVRRAAALVVFDLAAIAYGIFVNDKVVIGLFVVILILSVRSLKARMKVRETIETSLEANTEFLLLSQQVEHLMSRLWREQRDAQLATIAELAAIHSSSALNRRIEVALERAAASPDPTVSAAATNALQSKQQSIGHMLQLQAA